MNKFIIETKGKSRIKEIEIEVEYVPFPSEEARREVYRKWVKAFLSTKLRRKGRGEYVEGEK